MMKRNSALRRVIISALAGAAMILCITAIDSSAQTNRRRTAAAKPRVSNTPVPQMTEPVVISRADDFRPLPAETPETAPGDTEDAEQSSASDTGAAIDSINARIKDLEDDRKQKRLLLNLDILTRAEQRAETLRRQRFDMLEKENQLNQKLDELNNDLRPEMIERSVATIGSLRPEELREARRKHLESEKRSVESMLSEIQTTRSSLEQSVQRADALVERLRVKLEKEIDDSLGDIPQ